MVSRTFKNIVVTVFISFVTLEVAAVLANDFFFEKAAKEEAQKRDLPEITANAIKHAYASNLIYSGLRNINFNASTAKNITIFLGKVNEVAELLFKSPKDSSLEMIKDLENNVLGICSARWIEKNSANPLAQDRLALIGTLAERELLIITEEDIILAKEKKEKAKKSFNYFLAKDLFKENERKIVCDFNLDTPLKGASKN